MKPWTTPYRLQKEDTQGARVAAFVLALLGLASILLGLSGCGKQAFVVASTTNQQTAPGYFTIPPKVDILFVEDDTGSMHEAYDSIAKQAPVFLEGLEAKGWNYHFATIPLTKDRPISQVMASKHDANWGSDWIPAYPGQKRNEAGMVNSSVFRRPVDYGGFISQADIRDGLGGLEPGFSNLQKALFTRTMGTGLIRPDALLVVFMMSTGNDTSDIKYCYIQESGGQLRGVPCDSAPTQTVGEPYCGTPGKDVSLCTTSAKSFENFSTEFAKIKPSRGLVKFYSAVANGGQCDGYGYTKSGTRYYQMSSSFGGLSFNLCQQQISTIFDSLSSHLQSLKVGIRTRYLFVPEEPESSSIVVTKLVGGQESNAVTLKAGVDYEYVGYKTDISVNEYAVNPPVPFNKASGYAIELKRSGILTGDDTAKVEYKTKGLQDSAK